MLVVLMMLVLVMYCGVDALTSEIGIDWTSFFELVLFFQALLTLKTATVSSFALN